MPLKWPGVDTLAATADDFKWKESAEFIPSESRGTAGINLTH